MNNTNDDDYDVPVISKHTSQRYVDFDDEMPLKQNLIEESKSPQRGDDDDNDYSFISKRVENKEQPMSHEEAKNLCQKMFPKLAEGTKLTKEELEVFYQFKVEQVQTYDHMNLQHEVG
jgi:thymidylate synthase ThyX